MTRPWLSSWCRDVKRWAIHRGDGIFEQVFSDTRPKVKSAVIVEIDRFGDLTTERHDPKAGWVQRDTADRLAAIDAGFDIDNPGARAIEYAIKEIEAHIILGTLLTEGRLAREAVARGVSVEELATQVLAKAEQTKPGQTRIAAKLALTQSQGATNHGG